MHTWWHIASTSAISTICFSLNLERTPTKVLVRTGPCNSWSFSEVPCRAVESRKPLQWVPSGPVLAVNFSGVIFLPWASLSLCSSFFQGLSQWSATDQLLSRFGGYIFHGTAISKSLFLSWTVSFIMSNALWLFGDIDGFELRLELLNSWL